MFETKTARRVVVIVDASLKDQMIDEFKKRGVTGYNCMGCSGEGLHAVTGELFNCEELVRIEMIGSHELAAKILDYVHAVQFQQFGNYALAAFTDTVEVDIRDQSLTR